MATTASGNPDPSRPLEWVKPPLQARSQKTMERLLDAAEAMITDEGIDGATVAEIAKRAGSSVGSFYARFNDKEALVRTVLERFTTQAEATATAVLEPGRWDGVPVREALIAMVRFMLQVVEERRGLIVALLVRSTRDPDLNALGQRLHDRITLHLHGLIAQRGHAVSHPDPETAIRVAVWMVLSSMETRVLYDEGAGIELSDETVAAEVAEMIIRYVGIEGTERGVEPAPTSGARIARPADDED